jgi:hypothetical protein
MKVKQGLCVAVGDDAVGDIGGVIVTSSDGRGRTLGP